jgi:hypothetical protein
MDSNPSVFGKYNIDRKSNKWFRKNNSNNEQIVEEKMPLFFDRLTKTTARPRNPTEGDCQKRRNNKLGNSKRISSSSYDLSLFSLSGRLSRGLGMIQRDENRWRH